MSKKKRKFRFLLVLEILIILAVAIAGIGYYMINHYLNKVQRINLSQDSLTANNGVDTKKMEPFETIALYGVDSQKKQLGKGNRSDSIILVALEKETKKIRLLSIYRDTYVYIDDKYKYTKITHAYAYGGPEMALATLNKNFDLHINKFVTVNFKVLAECIDLLGGIEVDVKSNELGDLNRYIPNMNKLNGGSSKLIANTGKQTLDGNQATAYARIRKNSGGDFKRSERQREIIAAMFAKVKSNPTKAFSILDKVLPNVLTNIDNSTILSLAKNLISYDIEDTVGFPFETQGQSIDRLYYGLPVTLESNTIKMHQFLYNAYDYKPSDSVKKYSNDIESLRNKSRDFATTECPTTQWKNQRKQ